MPLIIIQPHDAHEARLRATTDGTEFITYRGRLDPRMNIRFARTEEPFPANGFVRLRRGYDHGSNGERILDEFRFEPSFEDSDSDQVVPAKWVVYLQVDGEAFDRLVQRLHWGLPELRLSFDVSSEVVTFDPGTDWEDLYFLADPRPWERVSGAELVQIPFPAG